MIPTEATERHRAIAGRFAELTRGVADTGWDAPSPVEEWAARDVVRHLVTWLPGLLAGGSDVVLLAGPSVDDDPVEAWRVHAEAVQAVLDDPVAAYAPFSNPHTGEMPVAQAIDRFYTTDVFLHSWDFATATGQTPALDGDECRRLFEGMEPLDAMLRASGQYGPRVDVSPDAPPQDRLIAFIGRNPAWQRPMA
ncbi:TIGR03086 family metal-binding protein [Herbiconiux moechotypicola]|uniref:Maleylpyruvate isomerase family mycothiol-dependent enzyme n=1 Tax=Herbiconiux moechotypicola TaxID=637393 RepID=A0ABP5Q2K3_9MICO|nr:TIGR03086 family metal-binding protein [Herbiconiux moechotypicola]MCS5728245.1 TIGR03086 family metal-binding protein [Herbiconiux moechotypicola]